MFKKISVFILLLVTCYVKAQQDTSALDKLTPEELLQYYINEPEPWFKYKGPEKVGDSLFTDLNTKVIPTETVVAKGLYHESEDLTASTSEQDSAFNAADQALKPKVALGTGRLGFDGDIYSKHFQSPLTARYAFDLNISQRLTRYLQLNFNVMFGKLGAHENKLDRHANFISEIRAGGLNLLYDFGNFIPDRFTVRPYLSLGVTGFEFLSKTDIKDANGNTYYYWSDGSIKDMPEGAPGAQYANTLKRDYVYETDVRESNVALFGKYPERSWAVPIGAGFIMKVTDRVDLKMNFQYFFTATDYIDGLNEQNRGNKIKDKFSYTSVSLQYDLIAKPIQKKKKSDAYQNVNWLALDSTDYDQDGVTDWNDKCQGTPKEAKVTADGCPEDTDNDGVPNYRDDEPSTPTGLVVDAKGVALNDDHWKKWYDQYMNDSTDANMTTEYVGNVFALNSNKTKVDQANKDRDVYTVELARYNGSIPSDEMAFLLSIGDINSTTLEDGTTIVYTSGNYKKIKNAAKRRDEYVQMGNKDAAVAKMKGKKITRLTEDELTMLLNQEKIDDNKSGADSSKVANNINPNNTSTTTANDTEGNAIESFGKDDVVYRVQLGAFKNKISTSVFNTSAGVLELNAGENVYRYVTKGYKTIEEAAAVRADLVIQGYSDAFVTAYKGGKRIPMTQTKATVEKGYKEDLNENKMFSSVNKKLVAFKIQLGPNKRPAQVAAAEERFKDLKQLEKQSTTTGNVRFTTGSFTGYDAAEKYRKELEEKGFTDAFIIATFKDELISIQEALELLK
ncbi:MAG: SPOR domain-containing protein [Sphingobacteriaceae bacterium]